jgi:hypothetical protein
MKTNKKEKTYDAVKMIREIRDKISAETQDMTCEEFKLYIKKRLENRRLKTVES